jgi:hypothetical protein
MDDGGCRRNTILYSVTPDASNNVTQYQYQYRYIVLNFIKSLRQQVYLKHFQQQLHDFCVFENAIKQKVRVHLAVLIKLDEIKDTFYAVF